MERPAHYLKEPATSSLGNYLHGVSAPVLGWTLEAYEYFVLVFIVDALARDFHVSKEAVIRTFIATLAMRPLGALLFGMLADRATRPDAVTGGISALQALPEWHAEWKLETLMEAIT